jgi:MscS family membrane protein
MNESYANVLYVIETGKNTPGLFYPSELEINRKRAEQAFQRAMQTLNLKEIPPATRADYAAERVLLLKEVLDRIELPSAGDVPDLQMVEEQGLTFWRLPKTEIILEEADNGSFLFSKDTLDRLPQFYQEAKQLPYQPGATGGFYELYISKPGQLVPPKWSLWLPAWTEIMFLEQTVLQWFLIISVIVLNIALFWYLQKFLRKQFPAQYTVKSAWLALVLPLVGIIVLPLSDTFIDEGINATGLVLDIIKKTDTVLLFAFLTWLAFLLFNAIGSTIISAPRFQDKLLEATMIRNGFRLLGIVAGATVIALGSSTLGISVAPLLASLGAGSLAISFGLQPYVRDTIGGITLFANGSMRIGDFCEFGGVAGTVEDIGLRATLIRTPDRKLIMVPNANVSTTMVNHSRRDKFVFERTLKLVDDGNRDQISKVMHELREFLEQQSLLADVAVSLSDLSGTSFTLDVFAYILTTNEDVFREKQAELLLKIDEVIQKLGVKTK